MPIFKRNGVYYIDIRTPSGERIKRSTRISDRRLAKQYHDKVKHELWSVDKLDKKQDRVFEEIMVLFLKDSEAQKRYDAKQAHVRYWTSVFGGQKIANITGEQILNNIPTHHITTKQPISNATKNRYRASILRAFSLAHKIGWLDSVPYVPRMTEPKVRVRWVEKIKLWT